MERWGGEAASELGENVVTLSGRDCAKIGLLVAGNKNVLRNCTVFNDRCE